MKPRPATKSFALLQKKLSRIVAEAYSWHPTT
jgi:hypothetical protein